MEDPHHEIARQERRLRRNRVLWIGGVLSFFLWPAGIPFGLWPGLIVLLLGLVVTPFSIAIGLGGAYDAKKTLREVRGTLPQLPAARVIER